MKLLGKYNNVIKILFLVFCLTIIAFISYYEFIYRTNLNIFFSIKPEQVNSVHIKTWDLGTDEKNEFTYTDRKNIKSLLQSLGELEIKRKAVKELLFKITSTTSYKGDSEPAIAIDIDFKDVNGNFTSISIFGKSISVMVMNTNTFTSERYEFETIDKIDNDKIVNVQ